MQPQLAKYGLQAKTSPPHFHTSMSVSFYLPPFHESQLSSPDPFLPLPIPLLLAAIPCFLPCLCPSSVRSIHLSLPLHPPHHTRHLNLNCRLPAPHMHDRSIRLTCANILIRTPPVVPLLPSSLVSQAACSPPSHPPQITSLPSSSLDSQDRPPLHPHHIIHTVVSPPFLLPFCLSTLKTPLPHPNTQNAAPTLW